MRGFILNALEHRHGAPAPDFEARAAFDALEHADVFDRQDAFLALVANAAGAIGYGRFRRHCA